MPVVIGVVAVLAIGAIAFLIMGSGGEPEFAKPPVTGKTPDHILNTMDEKQRNEILKQEQAAGVRGDGGASQQPQQNPYSQGR